MSNIIISAVAVYINNKTAGNDGEDGGVEKMNPVPGRRYPIHPLCI